MPIVETINPIIRKAFGEKRFKSSSCSFVQNGSSLEVDSTSESLRSISIAIFTSSLLKFIRSSMFVRDTQVLYEGVSFLKIIRISDLSSYYLHQWWLVRLAASQQKFISFPLKSSVRLYNIYFAKDTWAMTYKFFPGFDRPCGTTDAPFYIESDVYYIRCTVYKKKFCVYIHKSGMQSLQLYGDVELQFIMSDLNFVRLRNESSGLVLLYFQNSIFLFPQNNDLKKTNRRFNIYFPADCCTPFNVIFLIRV